MPIPERDICGYDYNSESHGAMNFVHGCKHIFGEEYVRPWLNMHGSPTCLRCLGFLAIDHDPSNDDEDDSNIEKEDEDDYDDDGFISRT